MFITRPDILEIERRVQALFPTLLLAFNERKKSHSVIQDLRRCANRINPHITREPELEGIPGIGETCTYTWMFDIEPPDANRIIEIVRCHSIASTDVDKEEWRAFRDKQEKYDKAHEASADCPDWLSIEARWR